MEGITLLQSARPEFFVGWGTLALIIAALAQGKNRNGLVWFVLGLIGGPLALLVLVLMPRIRSSRF